MIDPRRLEALVALHRHGTVSAAAEALHYGQPTVSHHLRRLEAETGSVLVQRVGRGVRLTPDGERLARRGEEVLGLLDRAEAELAAATDLRAGRVRLAAFPSAAATLVPDAVALLARRHPGIELALVEAEPPEAATLLRAGEVDLAVTFTYPDLTPGPRDARQEPTGLDTRPVLDEPLHLLTPRSGPWADARRLEDLTDARWITGCERCRTELLSLCAAAGFTPDIAYASDDYVAVQALVAAGLGVTVLPDLAVRAHRHRGAARHRLRGAVRRVELATHGEPPLPATVEAAAVVLAEVGRRVGRSVKGRSDRSAR